MNNKKIHLELDDQQALNLVGLYDKNIKILSDCFEADIQFYDNTFIIKAEKEEICNQVEEVLIALQDVAKKNQRITERDIFYAYQLVTNSEKINFDKLYEKVIGKTLTGKMIYPKTKGQLEFIQAIENNDIVLGIGPAGTGKTYLSVIHAVTQLKKGIVKKIVLTRPAVEAGESLGFLPGDLKEKIDPYLIPLYDALYDMLGIEQTQKLIERNVIEIIPLAYMRGRTLEEAFIILDEAQNTTRSQMKMFLTRLGNHSKMIVTGDLTQIDLRGGIKSGLKEASRLLRHIEGISILYFHQEDVIRHRLVQKIIGAYEKNDVS